MKPQKTLQEQPPELREGQSVELLKELHILTREAQLNQDTRRKLKQVYHLVQFIEPLLAEVLKDRGDVTLADHGAGKSYLGFILYDLFFKQQAVGHVYGVESRAELVEKSRALAQRLGFKRMGFLATTVQQALTHPDLPERIDVVTALHACDTATDDAIAFGLAKRARFMVLVPCCQAEVAGVMRERKALNLSRTPLAELWRHPLHTRVRQPDHQCAALPAARSARLRRHGHRAGGLGTLDEERADPGAAPAAGAARAADPGA